MHAAGEERRRRGEGEKNYVSNPKGASFMIYVGFDASLISNTNMSCFSTVQTHLQQRRKCGPGFRRGHRPGELGACGLVDRGKYFVISRV